MIRRASLPLALLVTLALAACSDDPGGPQVPPEAPALTAQLTGGGGGLSGAIFTTTPDGGVVNENVHYPSKLHVYLDGGPGPNAPQTAASLDDGLYVFQVTNPSGHLLLSMDPAKCRVVEVADGVIQRLVPPGELGLADGYTRNGQFAESVPACHIADPPDPFDPAGPNDAGTSGRHDTNTDLDHGPPAVVVQLMPYGTTPNPGGVSKAWVTPLDVYVSRRPDGHAGLDQVPMPIKGRGSRDCPDFCAGADPGFGPPRSMQKTDNFKAVGVPPAIEIIKFHDVNGNGVWDEGEPEISGFEILIRETLADGTVIENVAFTPVFKTVAPNTTIEVCEVAPSDQIQSFLSVDGEVQAVAECVTLTTSSEVRTHRIVFGNFEEAVKTGVKFHDLDGDGERDAGEPGLEGWTIRIVGTSGLGEAVDVSDVTDAAGVYQLQVSPGSYTVCEALPSGWNQSFPSSGAACQDIDASFGPTGYAIALTSGQVDEGNDFGNFRMAEKSGAKRFDRDGDGSGDKALAGFEIHLLDASGSVVATTTTDDAGAYSFSMLQPGAYTVCEVQQPGFFQTAPRATDADVADCSALGATYAPLGHQFTLQSGQVHAGNDFCNGFVCAGLSPGFWTNWRNHFTAEQFLFLLSGTIADGDIAGADAILKSTNCDADEGSLGCMTRFLLSNQLTLRLTASPGLPNPSGGSLNAVCELPGVADDLGFWLERALGIHAAGGAGFTRDEILEVKTVLDFFANLNAQ